MQLWDDILYPSFRATIRGEYYGIVTEDAVDEECFHLAERAIATFKFPRISTDYEVYYAKRLDDHTLQECNEKDDGAVPHGKFKNNLTPAEIEIIVAWMKVYWCEVQVSNSDNFDEIYTDPNIKTYSRANSVDKTMKLMREFRIYARRLENDYSRTSVDRKPTMGDINE